MVVAGTGLTLPPAQMDRGALVTSLHKNWLHMLYVLYLFAKSRKCSTGQNEYMKLEKHKD